MFVVHTRLTLFEYTQFYSWSVTETPYALEVSISRLWGYIYKGTCYLTCRYERGRYSLILAGHTLFGTFSS